jgi:hypothetical protein
MASGMMYGILKEQHADHIVLSEHTRVRLADGLKLTQLGVGARIALTYHRNPDRRRPHRATALRSSTIPAQPTAPNQPRESR